MLFSIAYTLKSQKVQLQNGKINDYFFNDRKIWKE